MIAWLCTTLAPIFVPPVEQRTPHTLLSLAKVASLSAIGHALAIHIRLRYPNVPLTMRLAYLSLIAVFALRWTMSHYVFFAQQASSKVLQGISNAIDTSIGCGALCIVISVADALLLCADSEYTVLGAQAYRKWLKDQFPALTEDQLARMEHKMTGGNSFEKPRYFPGTMTSLEHDMLGSQRGFGYGIESPIAPAFRQTYKAGYDALIASEKLAKQANQEQAIAIKRDAISRAVQTISGYAAVFAALIVLFKHTTMILDENTPVEKLHYYPSLFEVTSKSPLGAKLTTFLATGAYGVMLICVLQVAYLTAYVIALSLTRPAYRAPIVISRWEPYLFFKPYAATSMKDVWRVHWHSMPRRFFIVTCFRPAMQVCSRLRWPQTAGRAIAMLCSFALSGLIHEFSLEVLFGRLYNKQANYGQRSLSAADEKTIRAAGYGFGANWFAKTLSFVSFGLVILIEQIWTVVEGKIAVAMGLSTERLLVGRPRYVAGWIWTMIMMCVCGIGLINVWSMHGLFATL